MKSLIVFSLFIACNANAQYLVTNPTSSSVNVISPTASGVTGLSVTGTDPNNAAAIVSNSSNGSYSDGVDVFVYNGYGYGIYSQAYNGYGIMATSAYGTAGYFTSQNSTNTAPTLLTQSISVYSTADLFEAQDVSMNVLLFIDNAGSLHTTSGLQLPANGMTCSVTTRGNVQVVYGGSGVADIFQVCLKAHSGSYSWVTK